MPAIPASHRDLLDAQVATLGTIGPDGRPQLSEVWFLADGETVGISLNTSRQKTKNLLANPAVSLFILDLTIPMRYLELRVGAKYDADLRAHDGMGVSRVVVTIRPVRVNAVDMRG